MASTLILRQMDNGNYCGRIYMLIGNSGWSYSVVINQRHYSDVQSARKVKDFVQLVHDNKVFINDYDYSLVGLAESIMEDAFEIKVINVVSVSEEDITVIPMVNNHLGSFINIDVIMSIGLTDLKTVWAVDKSQTVVSDYYLFPEHIKAKPFNFGFGSYNSSDYYMIIDDFYHGVLVLYFKNGMSGIIYCSQYDVRETFNNNALVYLGSQVVFSNIVQVIS